MARSRACASPTRPASPSACNGTPSITAWTTRRARRCSAPSAKPAAPGRRAWRRPPEGGTQMDLGLAGKRALDHGRLEGHRPRDRRAARRGGLRRRHRRARAGGARPRRRGDARATSGAGRDDRGRSRAHRRGAACRAGSRAGRYPGEQCRRDPARHAAQVEGRRWREAWDLKVFGFIDLTRAIYAGDEGARRRRDRQRGGRGRREIPPGLHRRRGGERGADGLHPRARPRGAGRQHARGRHQSRPGRDRAHGDAATRSRRARASATPSAGANSSPACPSAARRRPRRSPTPSPSSRAHARRYTTGTILTIDGGG